MSGIGIHPFSEGIFLNRFLRFNFIVHQLLRLPDKILPIVGHPRKFRGVLQAHSGINIHVLAHYVQFFIANVYNGLIFHAQRMINSVAGEVAVCAPRISEDHREIAIFYTCNVYGKVVFRFDGHVLFRIVRGFPIGASVNAEHREVARVAWPHPVVGVATKLPNSLGWRAH